MTAIDASRVGSCDTVLEVSRDDYAPATSWRQDTSRSAHEWLRIPLADEAHYEPYRFVLEHGRDYTPAALPVGIQRGKKMCCFANAFKLAAVNRHLAYIEGYGTLTGSDTWLYRHAWCADASGEVVDPTWGFPGGVPLALRGLELPLDLVEPFCKDYSRGLLDGGPADRIPLIARRLGIQWS